MGPDKVAVFRCYPFAVGQKIRIEDGPRAGDWEVVEVGERKVTLRCPLSGREFAWDRFAYHVAEADAMAWPQED
jgi:hypothetical protein